MGKNKKNKIRVRFIGNNAEDVTGSMTLIETQTQNILVECGLVQGGSTLLADYKANSKRFEFKPKDLNWVFVCHCHADHICGLPRLYKNGCTAKIIAPRGSYELAKILLNDSAYIMGKDSETLKRKHQRDFEPIYTAEDVDECLKYWTEYDIGTQTNISDELSFCYQGSGHIINACQIELWIKSGNNTKKILYTSDLGNRIPKSYINPFTPVNNANLVIGESTYSNQMRSVNKKDRVTDLLKMSSVIDEFCYERKGRVLIPTFAIDRTQNIITYLYDLFKDDENCPTILIDSPMACKVTELYANLLSGDEREKYLKILSWDKLKLIKEYEDSKSYQMSTEPLICLAASGMLQAGRSVAWAGKLLPSERNCILFVGFSAENSLATRIKQGKTKTVTIDGKPILNKCSIVDLHSFSSHMQYDELIEYYSNINCEKIALVHGNFKDKCEFAKQLQSEISRKNKNSKVISVNRSTELLL